MSPTATTPPTTTAPPAAARGRRDPWLDNAKMALVTLVVVGHAWVLLPQGRVVTHLYDFLYAWHIPAFVLVTGYLSRSFTLTPGRVWALVRTVAVPYVLFEAALTLFRVHVGGEPAPQDLFRDPHWPMWYLAALFVWRLLTPALRALGPLALPVAVGVSLLGGAWAPTTLDLARVMGLLPFFVLGLLATPERLELLRGRVQVALALVVMATLAVLATWTDDWASTRWLYWSWSYGDLGVGDLRAVVTRAVLLLVGAAGAGAFLALVPRRGGWFAAMGSATLVVYLFHGFAVRGAEYAGFGDWAASRPVLGLVVATAAAVGLALLLAWAPLSRRLDVAVDPLGHAQRAVGAALDLARDRPGPPPSGSRGDPGAPRGTP